MLIWYMELLVKERRARDGSEIGRRLESINHVGHSVHEHTKESGRQDVTRVKRKLPRCHSAL